MNAEREDRISRMLRGALAGLVAGVAASFAMDRFQAAVSALTPSDGSDDGDAEPATEKAADGVARAVTGHEVARPDKPMAGQGVHHAFGIGLGIAYGIAAEYRPAVTTGYGAVFGLGTATLFDEALVPAAGLGDAPWKAGASSHLYSYASHLVFSGTAELVRAQVAATLRPAG